MAKTFDQLLKRIAPNEMQEFFKAPWDYEISSPVSTESPAVILVHLEIGTTKCEKVIDIEIDLMTKTATTTVANRKGQPVNA